MTRTASPNLSARDVHASHARPDPRLANLDLLRAAAIMLVVVFHTVTMWPGSPTWLISCTKPGRLGVDLFFVLSGWLIGGLFWKEYRRFHNVLVPRFMLRRLIRTVPPYLVALLAAWLGARKLYATPPAFDWKYLVFIQNYFTMPYFQPSWSLCVEEHFYLVMPGLLAVLALGSIMRLRWFLPVLACLPLILRNIFPDQWRRHDTVTHAWLDGLIFGVCAAYVRCFFPEAWKRMRRVSGWLVGPAIIYVAFNEYLDGYFSAPFQMHFGITLTALSFTSILVFVVDRTPLRIAQTRATYLIAIWSYSLYLTHSLAINAAKVVAGRLPGTRGLAYAIAGPVIIVLAGVGMHYFVEAPSIRLRDFLAPRRPLLKETNAESDPGI